MKTLSGKISIFGIGISIFTGIIFSIYSLNQQRDYLLNSRLDDANDAIELVEKSVKSEVNQLKSDVRFLASTPPIRGILRATRNGGIDPVDGSTLKIWKDRLGTIFQEMLYAKTRYSQIRYIGMENNGLEIVRANKSGTKVYQVNEENLQEKSNEPYYKEIEDSVSRKVYLSDFSLNREFGQIVIPEELVLRAAMPIYEIKDKKFGFVIVNVDYTQIFNALNLILSKGTEYYIINDNKIIAESVDGHLKHKIKEIDKKNIFSIYEHIKEVRDQKKVSRGAIYRIEKDGKFYIEKKIYYNDLHPDEYVSVLVVISKKNLLSNLNTMIQKNALVLFLIILIAIIVSIFFSNLIGQPIKVLNRIVEDVKMGNTINEVNYEKGIKSTDEIGLVSKTIVKMSKDLVEKNIDLTRKQKAMDISAIVAETDTKGKITYVNDNFVRISKYPKSELLGADHRILNSGHHSKEFFSDMWATILRGQTWRGEIKNKAKDGTYYWVETTIYPYLKPDGSIEKFVAIRFDITEKKNSFVELERARDELTNALKAKSNFMANMSHEIRTPLNGIIGFSTLLLDQKLSNEASEKIEHIKNCSESLLNIINDILDLSKIEAGKLSVESIPFELEKIIEATLYVFSTIISHKGVSLNYHIDDSVPKFILGDPLRLRQILLNLVGNAVKFTEEGEINVRVSIAQKFGEKYELKFLVKDTGIGISQAAQAKLFDAFEQADTSTTRKYGGSGLGLAISRKLVKVFGGDIRISSELGVGSEFEFTIKTIEADVEIVENFNHIEDQTDNFLVSQARKALKVLLVEDNKINQKIAVGFLNKLKIENITIANDGVEAVSACERVDFDIVFMDIQMPNMDGYTATREIRNKLASNVYIVGLSANVFAEDKEKGFECGMNDYIEKPLKKNRVVDCLTKYFKGKKTLAS